MQSSDDKDYPLAKMAGRARPGRAVSKKDFALPKPYRRQLFSDEPQRLTRLQVSALGFAGVMVCTLVAVLALMAHESERSPDGKLIVAAARLDSTGQEGPLRVSYPPPALIATPQRSLPPAPASRLKNAALAPARQAAIGTPSTPKPAARRTLLPRTTAVPRKPLPRAAALPVRDPRTRPLHTQAASTPAPDPDVALITAILLLTPAPAPAAAPAISMELAGRSVPVCIPALPKEASCSDPGRLKP